MLSWWQAEASHAYEPRRTVGDINHLTDHPAHRWSILSVTGCANRTRSSEAGLLWSNTICRLECSGAAILEQVQ